MISLKIAVIVCNSLNGLLSQYMSAQIHSGSANSHTKLDTRQAVYPKQNHKFRQNTLSYQGPNTRNI